MKTLDTKEARRVLGEWRDKKGKVSSGIWGFEIEAVSEEHGAYDRLIYHVQEDDPPIATVPHYSLGNQDADAVFIVYARNTPIDDHLEAALDEVERLQKENETLQDAGADSLEEITKLLDERRAGAIDYDYGGVGRAPIDNEAGRRLWDEASDKEQP